MLVGMEKYELIISKWINIKNTFNSIMALNLCENYVWNVNSKIDLVMKLNSYTLIM
jgi:hypothetical protein